MTYVIEFRQEEERYVAIGSDPMHLSVYELLSERRIVKTRIFYLACLRFMPWAEVSETKTYTAAQVKELYDIRGRT